MLPKADAHGVREVPCKKEKQEISLPTAIASAASTCLDLCGCVIFFRVAAGVLLSVTPLPDSAAACVSAACEITAGCAAFAALGGKAALYGICLAMSLLGFSVWGQLRLLLQGRVPMRMLAISRLLHAVLFPLLVRLLRGVNLIPLVGGANRLLGLVLGLVTGAFDCWLLALLLWFAASITTGQIDWLTTGVLQRSVGYSLFGAFNPFLLHY